MDLNARNPTPKVGSTYGLTPRSSEVTSPVPKPLQVPSVGAVGRFSLPGRVFGVQGCRGSGFPRFRATGVRAFGFEDFSSWGFRVLGCV